MTTELHIAADLSLPLDAVTETFLIFGRKGSGKTATAGVFAEELITAGLPVAVLDPMGAWWGLRASADGKSPGLPVLIAGGEHADIPLEHGAGSLMADLVVEEHLPVVLDMFLMSKTQQRHFVTDFMERLFHRNRDPMHLIIDEADRWAPQRGTTDMARLLGAYEDIVLRGRRLGLGSTSITLRVAQLNSTIRSQVAILVAMQMLGKLDINAMDEWIRVHASDEDARELKASLPSLPVGTAWIWSPGWLDLLQKVQIRPRRTFDSSATPRVGEKRIVPRTLAEIDLTALQKRMASVIEKAGQDDPKALRQRIRELERLLAQAAAGPTAEAGRRIVQLEQQLAAALARPPERIEIPALSPGDVAALEQAITGLRDVAGSVEIALSRAASAPAPVRQSERAPAPVEQPERLRFPRAVPVLAPAFPANSAAPPPSGDPAPLSKAQRSILTVLAQFPLGRTKRQLGIIAGYSAKGGGFNNALSSLRTAGYISRGEPITATGEGVAALGSDWEPLPAGPALIDHWMGQLSKAEAAALRAVLDAYPETLTKAEIAARAGYAESGGGFNNALSRLRTLQLIDGYGDIRADDTIGAAASA